MPYLKWLLIFVFGAVFLVAGFYAHKERLISFLWTYGEISGPALFFHHERADLLMEIGRYYFGGGAHDLDRAAHAFRAAHSVEPWIQGAHYQLGRIAFIRGDFATAIYQLNKELELHPNHLRPHYMLGLVFGYRGYAGDLARAEEHFRTFVEWSPEEWAGYNDLAWVQVQQGKYEEAKTTILEGFERIPWTKEQNLWFWNMLGVAELNLENYDEAEAAFLKTRELANNVDAEFFWSAYPGNDARNAESSFEQFKAALNFNLGLVYENREEHELALKEFREYLDREITGVLPKTDVVKAKVAILEAYAD